MLTLELPSPEGPSKLSSVNPEPSQSCPSFPWGFPGGPRGKEPACNAGAIRDGALIPGWGRSPGSGHSNPLQYSCLENPMDRGAWQATVHRITKRQTWLKQLSMASFPWDCHPSPPMDSCSMQASFHNSKPTCGAEAKRRGGRNDDFSYI